jgi:Co/Zn/Cd efflux system component
MNRAARMARLSILSNTILIAMKLAVGILSGAVSIISEAIHSFMDLAAAVMAFFSIRIAQRPPDTLTGTTRWRTSRASWKRPSSSWRRCSSSWRR